MQLLLPGPPKPTISSIANGASFAAGPIAAGSLVTLKGANFDSNNVVVTFDGITARMLYSSPDQVNVQVPAELGNKQTASVVVTVNGQASAAATVTLQSVAPGIFVPGILNQDNTVNSAGNPATAGSTDSNLRYRATASQRNRSSRREAPRSFDAEYRLLRASSRLGWGTAGEHPGPRLFSDNDNRGNPVLNRIGTASLQCSSKNLHTAKTLVLIVNP